MPPTGGAAFRLEGPPKGSAAPMGNRDGADNRKAKKLAASTSNRYEPQSAPSTGSKPGLQKTE